MTAGLAIHKLDDWPASVKQFFEALGQETAIIQDEGRVVCVVHPISGLSEDLRRRTLEAAKGTWSDIPAEILEQIAHRG